VTRVLCVGHAVQDFVFGVSEIPTRTGKHRAQRFESVGGGPAATAAVAIARLGGTALLAARLGDDRVADLVVGELLAAGVDCSLVRRFGGCTSSVSAVLVDERGERLIVNHLDARLPADPAWLPEPGTIACRAVLADTRWPEGALRMLRAARAAGIPGVLDADRPMPSDGRLLEAATHVAFSADALCDLTGITDPVAGLNSLATAHAPWMAVTVGAQGVYATHAGRTRHCCAFTVPVVDTLGAGDVWHGAFALALAEGRTEEVAATFASAAAAVKVQRFGGRSGAPRRAEVEALLTAQQPQWKDIDT
jgi:sulfofructose kinase